MPIIYNINMSTCLKLWSVIICLFVLSCAPVYRMTGKESGKVPDVKIFLAEAYGIEVKGKDLRMKSEKSETKGKKLEIKDGKVKVDGKEVSVLTYPIEISTSDDIIGFNGKKYRGELIIYKTSDSKFQIINKVNVEDYLRGVVPCELRVDEFEALKAQAVIARSFSLSKVKGNRYDLKATVADQVYGGMEAEIKTTDKAINETCGIVCTYKGEVINAMYSSTCGGKTQDGRKPYLESKTCQFCKFSPHYRWESEHPLSAFGKVKSIRVSKRDRSRRIELVKITSDDGNQSIRGEELRAKLGLKSRFLDIRMKGDKIKISGKGYGHGIGLCQYGAIGMARKGYKYESILKYYYKGIRVEKIY